MNMRIIIHDCWLRNNQQEHRDIEAVLAVSDGVKWILNWNVGIVKCLEIV